MQTHPQTQATFTMPAKPHRFVASDRVEGTLVRRSDGTKIGTIERLMIDKVSGKWRTRCLVSAASWASAGSTFRFHGIG